MRTWQPHPCLPATTAAPCAGHLGGSAGHADDKELSLRFRPRLVSRRRRHAPAPSW
jgi:hypothetical protein